MTETSRNADPIVHDGAVLATVAPEGRARGAPTSVRYELHAREGLVLLRIFDSAHQVAGSIPLVPGGLHQLVFHGWVAPGCGGKAAAVLVPPTSIRKIVGHARRVFPEFFSCRPQEH